MPRDEPRCFEALLRNAPQHDAPPSKGAVLGRDDNEECVGRWAGPPSPLEYGSSRACKCRWAPYDQDHDPGQGQLPVSTIKAPGHRLPDARSSTRPRTI